MAEVDPKRIQAIKDAVKAECLRRRYSGSAEAYGAASYDFGLRPNINYAARTEHASKILAPLNFINSNKFPSSDGGRVVNNGDLAAAEAFLAVASNRGRYDSTSDCRSGCTGLCVGCTGSCTGGCSSCSGGCDSGCRGCDGCSGCGGRCSYSCSGDCDGGCSGCSGSCSGGCRGCTSSCGNNGCVGACVSSCSAGCTTGCGAACGSCAGNCSGVSA